MHQEAFLLLQQHDGRSDDACRPPFSSVPLPDSLVRFVRRVRKERGSFSALRQMKGSRIRRRRRKLDSRFRKAISSSSFPPLAAVCRLQKCRCRQDSASRGRSRLLRGSSSKMARSLDSCDAWVRIKFKCRRTKAKSPVKRSPHPLIAIWGCHDSCMICVPCNPIIRA